jgi:hypothetical protein
MRFRSILVLSAFLLLIASLAGAAVPDKAEFLASLSAAPAPAQPSVAPAGPAPTQPPAPEFLQTSTGCTSDDQCPAGKLCCRDCGFFGCTHKGCLTPFHGGCPPIP